MLFVISIVSSVQSSLVSQKRKKRQKEEKHQGKKRQQRELWSEGRGQNDDKYGQAERGQIKCAREEDSWQKKFRVLFDKAKERAQMRSGNRTPCL